MDNSYIKNNLEQIFESFKEMIKVETVVGQAVHIAMPSWFPSSTSPSVSVPAPERQDRKRPQQLGSGGGARLEPAAILVIKGDRVEMFSIKKDGYQAQAFEKLIAMAPEIIDKMKKDKYIYIHDEDEGDTAEKEEK